MRIGTNLYLYPKNQKLKIYSSSEKNFSIFSQQIIFTYEVKLSPELNLDNRFPLEIVPYTVSIYKKNDIKEVGLCNLFERQFFIYVNDEQFQQLSVFYHANQLPTQITVTIDEIEYEDIGNPHLHHCEINHFMIEYY